MSARRRRTARQGSGRRRDRVGMVIVDCRQSCRVQRRHRPDPRWRWSRPGVEKHFRRRCGQPRIGPALTARASAVGSARSAVRRSPRSGSDRRSAPSTCRIGLFQERRNGYLRHSASHARFGNVRASSSRRGDVDVEDSCSSSARRGRRQRRACCPLRSTASRSADQSHDQQQRHDRSFELARSGHDVRSQGSRGR